MDRNKLLEENIELSYEVHKLKRKYENAISYGIFITVVAIALWLKLEGIG